MGIAKATTIAGALAAGNGTAVASQTNDDNTSTLRSLKSDSARATRCAFSCWCSHDLANKATIKATRAQAEVPE
jgi:hypothetical protein